MNPLRMILMIGLYAALGALATLGLAEYLATVCQQ